MDVMEFRPDVIVMAADLPRVELLVEVRLTQTADELTRIEAQLKRYMRARDCAAGLLVTGGETRIYEDRYLTRSADSIEHVGTVPTAALVPVEPERTSAPELRRAFHEWLEHLATAQPMFLPSAPDVRRLVEKYVQPAVAGGRVSKGYFG